MIRYHMELRGIGIINIKHLFGVSAVRASKSVELVIELQRWDPTKKYDRLGLDGETYSILERERPLLRLPVASGRNLALLIEIAARNELLKSQGYDAAKEFARRVDEEIAKNAVEDGRRRVSRPTRPAPRRLPKSLVVVTGLSGSGKSYVNKCLEDMGYFCVDNLPLELVEPLLDQVTAEARRHHPRRPQPRFRRALPGDPRAPARARARARGCSSSTPRRSR